MWRFFLFDIAAFQWTTPIGKFHTSKTLKVVKARRFAALRWGWFDEIGFGRLPSWKVTNIASQATFHDDFIWFCISTQVGYVSFFGRVESKDLLMLISFYERYSIFVSKFSRSELPNWHFLVPCLVGIDERQKTCFPFKSKFPVGYPVEFEFCCPASNRISYVLNFVFFGDLFKFIIWIRGTFRPVSWVLQHPSKMQMAPCWRSPGHYRAGLSAHGPSCCRCAARNAWRLLLPGSLERNCRGKCFWLQLGRALGLRFNHNRFNASKWGGFRCTASDYHFQRNNPTCVTFKQIWSTWIDMADRLIGL